MLTTRDTPTSTRAPNESLALMLGGGGARGAYQAGVLRAIARRHPDLRLPILTGISAGAVNTTFLAAQVAPITEATEQLVKLWLGLTPDQVYNVQPYSLSLNTLRWGLRLVGGGHDRRREPTRGLLDTSPLRKFLLRHLPQDSDGSLPGIAANIRAGRLDAVALSATSYTTGQSVTWVEGRNVELWQRPQRRSELARITVEHVMASSSLPMLFPAVRIGAEWYGDGGVRLTAPLSPALHLGATRILTVATRYSRTRAEADRPLTDGYPPPAQVLSVLYNAIFLDLIDEDIMRLQRVNRLLEEAPESQREGMRLVDILVLRPSRDLGKLASEFEPRLPRAFRYLTRGLGTRRTASPDILSLLMFQQDYLRRLVDLGAADVEANAEAIDRFVSATTAVAGPQRGQR
ncbi:MAG: patatin-like phospholipase family protein [Gemmatimonadaceae bacterium]|nr:patatin-like phospholipase family protein [Gemmatimonadaceae bacterium]